MEAYGRGHTVEDAVKGMRTWSVVAKDTSLRIN